MDGQRSWKTFSIKCHTVKITSHLSLRLFFQLEEDFQFRSHTFDREISPVGSLFFFVFFSSRFATREILMIFPSVFHEHFALALMTTDTMRSGRGKWETKRTNQKKNNFDEIFHFDSEIFTFFTFECLKVGLSFIIQRKFIFLSFIFSQNTKRRKIHDENSFPLISSSIECEFDAENCKNMETLIRKNFQYCCLSLTHSLSSSRVSPFLHHELFFSVQWTLLREFFSFRVL